MAKHPALPIKVETVADAQARFGEAVAECWNGDEMVRLAGMGVTNFDRPAAYRRHVFDVDGFRILASRERHRGREVLHVSVSVLSGQPTWDNKQIGRALTLFLEISGFHGAQAERAVVKRPAGVLHVWYPWPLARAQKPDPAAS